MPPTPEQTETTLRFLFQQPVFHVMIIGGIITMVLLLMVLVMLIRMVTRRGNQDTAVQSAVLKITADLVSVTGKLTDRVEALADKAGMTSEQIATMSLIIASVNDSFGRFRTGMTRWAKADYTTKKLLRREMQEVRAQCSLLNQAVNRMDAVIRPEKQVIPLGKDIRK